MRRTNFTTAGFCCIYLLLGFLFWPTFEGHAQVKIGDNPQTIHRGSLLELESDELVLVITKVTMQQMNNLSPMVGALVYNTDIGCVYVYTGTSWVNLCNEGSSSGGVSVAPGNSIIDVGGAFYDNSILQEQVTNNLDNINTHIAVDEDTSAQNELSNLELDGTTMRLTNPLTTGNEVDLSPMLGTGGNPNDELITSGNVVGTDIIINEGASNQVTIDVSSLAGSDNTTFEVDGGNLNLTDGAGTLSVPLTDLDTENPTNELITSGNVVGTDIVINEGTGNQVTIDVSSLAGGDNTTFEVDGGNLNLTDGAGTLSVPLTDLNTGSDTNLANSNLTQTGGDRTYDLNNQNLVFNGTGNIGMGAVPPQEKVHVGGNLRVDGRFLDSSGDAGTAGQVLSATAAGTDWISPIVTTSPFHAVAKMNESSFVNAINVLFVSKLGTGNYQVNFFTAASSVNYVVQLSLLNSGPGTIEVTAQTTTSFTVQLYNNAGTPADGAWFFSVFDF